MSFRGPKEPLKLYIKSYEEAISKGQFPLPLVAQKVKRLPAMWEIRVRYLGQEEPLEKEMATHSGTLAWKIPWTEKPGRLQSMGSQRVRHDWATNTFLGHVCNDSCDSLVDQRIIWSLQSGRPGFDPWVRKILWRRKWQPTPVYLLGEAHGWRSLVGYSPQGRKESTPLI